MDSKRIQALTEFIRKVPGAVRARSRSLVFAFHMEEQHARLLGEIDPEGDGHKITSFFEFSPRTSAIVYAHCSCPNGTRGTICKHLSGLAQQWLEETEQRRNQPGRNSLLFLDKYFDAPDLQNALYRLTFDIQEGSEGLVPEIGIQRHLGADQYSPAKKFTVNDSYKMNQADPSDHAVLEYIRHFRQVLFYSSYPSNQKYGWAFWACLLKHPRLFFEGKPVSLVGAGMGLRLAHDPDGNIYRLQPAFPGFGRDHPRFFEIDGGLLGISRDHRHMLLCQCGALRRELFLEVLSNKPELTEKDLLENLNRLEKLRRFFELGIPAELEERVRKGVPSLVLRLNMKVDVGFSLKPRIKYPNVTARLIPNAEGIYLSSEDGDIIQRDDEEETRVFQEFLDKFPFDQEPDDNCDINIACLDTAFEIIDWLKDQDTWELEWQSKEISKQQIRHAVGLVVQVDTKAWLKIHLLSEGKTFELKNLAAENGAGGSHNYVEVSDGEWLQIDGHLRKQLDLLHMGIERHEASTRLKESALAVLGALDDVRWEGDPDWLERIRTWRDMDEGEMTPSGLLQADLRNYQLEGYRWLTRMSRFGTGACLADDMGLGKTVQALAVLLDRVDLGPTLVVTPSSVCFNWKEEIARFAPSLSAMLYVTDVRARGLTKLKKGDVVIVSYAMILRDIEQMADVEWGTLVLDEAQFIKNPVSQTAMAVARLNRAWTMALTGTPLENHLGELWSIFRMINPELLGSYERFRKAYIVPIEKDKNQEKMETLRGLIRPFVLRRTKNNVMADLPERTEVLVKVEMNEHQAARYQMERERILNQLDAVGEKMRFRLLADITRLRQIACHPALCDDRYKYSSAKLTLFSELIEELVSESHRALVFSQFTSFLDLIARELNRIRVPHLMMTGETPVKHRQAIIQRFQEGEIPVFLISLRAGGTGINLTEANYVFHMDPWWNPAVEEQATDRAHRIGQTQAVTVYRLVTAGTIEEAILKIHARKKDLVHNLLEGQDEVGKLKLEDLVDLIRTGEG